MLLFLAPCLIFLCNQLHLVIWSWVLGYYFVVFSSFGRENSPGMCQNYSDWRSSVSNTRISKPIEVQRDGLNPCVRNSMLLSSFLIFPIISVRQRGFFFFFWQTKFITAIYRNVKENDLFCSWKTGSDTIDKYSSTDPNMCLKLSNAHGAHTLRVHSPHQIVRDTMWPNSKAFSYSTRWRATNRQCIRNIFVQHKEESNKQELLNG